jgi:hypothetical protein
MKLVLLVVLLVMVTVPMGCGGGDEVAKQAVSFVAHLLNLPGGGDGILRARSTEAEPDTLTGTLDLPDTALDVAARVKFGMDGELDGRDFSMSGEDPKGTTWWVDGHLSSRVSRFKVTGNWRNSKGGHGPISGHGHPVSPTGGTGGTGGSGGD